MRNLELKDFHSEKKQLLAELKFWILMIFSVGNLQLSFGILSGILVSV